MTQIKNTLRNQFDVLYRIGKIKWEGPSFPSFYSGKRSSTPDIVFSNQKAFNLHCAAVPETSDNSILMVRISSLPIQISISERCLQRTNWQNYKKETGKITCVLLEGCDIKTIEEEEEEEEVP